VTQHTDLPVARGGPAFYAGLLDAGEPVLAIGARCARLADRSGDRTVTSDEEKSKEETS
jgi:hypothetical protein